MVEKVVSAGKGKAFDKAYIGLQLENHEYLRDLADAFIHNSTGVTDPIAHVSTEFGSASTASFSCAFRHVTAMTPTMFLGK